MATLTAVKFPKATGADEALEILERLQREGSIVVHDGAIVSWEEGAKKPKTRQLNNLTGSGALGGGFWGLLFGLIFFIPILGLLVGAAMGAAAASMADVGIDDDFIKEVREKVTPGTSALFALTSDGVRDKVAEAFRGVDAELLHTNLSTEQEAQLREVFSDAHAV
ncbi:DUF1269 domain-containing protein [Actinomycetospora chibensis]|uniref:DUF1269 domain-containing protein n=1 Tax=Actinomycetospora chibensis TaxID=663606 RepID=A0ABV9RPB9_9PSEU|nr:DUF1269 domain-containing protein [Actinomycetospora chibensis]MDD7922342.1 DUF1269 domain-containing protein [Actinomycetospora chibensis]